MKTLNQLVGDYTRLVQKGEVQAAYRGIFEFMGGCGRILPESITNMTRAVCTRDIWTCPILRSAQNC